MSKPTLALARPSTTRATAAAAKLAGEGMIRLVMEMAPATRRALKVRAAEEGTTIKAYLLGLAARDGVLVQECTDRTDLTDRTSRTDRTD